MTATSNGVEKINITTADQRLSLCLKILIEQRI